MVFNSRCKLPRSPTLRTEQLYGVFFSLVYSGCLKRTNRWCKLWSSMIYANARNNDNFPLEIYLMDRYSWFVHSNWIDSINNRFYMQWNEQNKFINESLLKKIIFIHTSIYALMVESFWAIQLAWVKNIDKTFHDYQHFTNFNRYHLYIINNEQTS